MKKDEYQNAFYGEPDAMPTEDAPEGATETPAVAVVIGAEPATAQTEPAAESASEPPAEAATDQSGTSADEPPAVDPAAPSPEDIQRQKSWEGRLKKREEELAAREAALAEKASGVPGAPETAGMEVGEGDDLAVSGAEDGVTGDAIENVKQRAQELRASGADLNGMVETAIQDFGLDLVAMFSILGSAMAGEGVNEAVEHVNQTVAQRIDEFANDVREAFGTLHLSAISDAHEDFQEIVQSEAFTAWMASLPEAERAKAQDVIDNGTAPKVVRLLTHYKDAIAQAETPADAPPPDPALEAAGAVRGSAPVRLPTKPAVASGDEYAEAWKAI